MIAAGRLWVGVSESNSRSSLYGPGEITLAWLTGKKVAGIIASETLSRSAKVNGATPPVCEHSNPGTLIPFCFGDTLPPLLEHERTLHPAQYDVGSFIQGSAQHWITSLGYMPSHIVLTRLVATRDQSSIGTHIVASGKPMRIFNTGREGKGCNRTYSGHTHQPTADRIRCCTSFQQAIGCTELILNDLDTGDKWFEKNLEIRTLLKKGRQAFSAFTGGGNLTHTQAEQL